MRFAKGALIVALATLMLCAAASAQTLRSELDPRNLSPSVGTGGPPGGPTGLFTIYDGQTIRRGEYTFSIAYSNFDRDPGDADFSEIPLSFNVGLNDYIELFFNTTAYRGVKTNSPAQLSGFYLPDVRLLGNGGQSAPAIVIGPTGPNTGTIAGSALFRPTGNQPFVPFPYIGGSAGTFGLTAGGGLFGFPGFSATLGPPRSSTNSGRFGSADAFPGIGSPVGGILPGIVLATTTLPPTILSLPITVPVTFTISPSYLPDAPFLSREYGESSFSTFVAGAKIRLTKPNNPLGFGLMPFYRWYADDGDSNSGFRQLQRGASPGAGLGDFGLVGFLDARLGKHVNLSVNAGYILNSNPRSNLGTGQEWTLLDRPDEVLTGVGMDFPINKHVQLITELRSTQYVGGRTPNAFENSPVDVVAGLKIYPRRWWGFGAAYRRHMNQQDMQHLNSRSFNTQINQTTNVFVPGRGIVVIPATTSSAALTGFPNNFRFSDDPNGFIAQLWIGKRNARAPEFLPNQPPTVTLSASSGTITLPCPPGTMSTTCTPSAAQTVQLTANATDPDNDTLLYTYNTTGGRITGEGPNVSWDLTGLQAGTYTSTVEVDDGCGCVSFSSTTVTVADCTNCVPPCPTITIDCPTQVILAGDAATVTVNVSGGAPNQSPTYTWSVTAGTISGGQGSPSITVDTTGLTPQTITATVDIGGLPPECEHTRSCSFTVGARPGCRLFDQYGNITFNDEKARLDNFASQLQQEPGTQAFIIAYGSCEGEGLARANRARDYLVNTRGIDAGRITVIDGGCRAELSVELHICQQGAAAPVADTTNAVSPCPACMTRPHRRPHRRHRGRHDDE
ncbi:MAG TPA: hypothetical protein VK619_13490 [Pyrinomonadaceae bacterium]|nr:hypothetical protein [Pyrinomonadaceae bacterium]